ncbi:hypothetical protein KHEC_PIHLHF_16475 [Escherichia coli]
MDRELKNLTLNISQLAALSGVHRQTAAARLQNLPVAGGHESNLKLYRVVDIVSAFLALPPPVAEGEMDAHERKAWYRRRWSLLLTRSFAPQVSRGLTLTPVLLTR